MRKAIAVLGFVSLLAPAALGQVAEGDQHWAQRAEGHQGGKANPQHVDASLAAYQRAVAANPNDLEARWKLLRSYRFKGAYTTSNNDEKKKIYAEAKKAGDSAMSVLDKELGAKGLKSVTKATEKQVADVARQIPGAGEVFLWDAINWGEWALAYGKMAAVREGAADRIKREATIAMLVDPKLEGGSPARVLGRLHDQTPHVPFITGWASGKEAVRLLNESLKVDPSNKITRTFLAEAMVNNDSNTKPQAAQLLKETISTPVDANYEVEQSAAVEDARALLKKWGA